MILPSRVRSVAQRSGDPDVFVLRGASGMRSPRSGPALHSLSLVALRTRLVQNEVRVGTATASALLGGQCPPYAIAVFHFRTTGGSPAMTPTVAVLSSRD